MDATDALIDRDVVLPGGALLTRSSAGATWSLPNLHGDTVVTTDGSWHFGIGIGHCSGIWSGP